MLPSSITVGKKSLCPFMKQAVKIPVENIGPLYQQFRNFCPFLSSLPTTKTFSDKSSKCPYGFSKSSISQVPTTTSNTSKCPFGFTSSGFSTETTKPLNASVSTSKCPFGFSSRGFSTSITDNNPPPSESFSTSKCPFGFVSRAFSTSPTDTNKLPSKSFSIAAKGKKSTTHNPLSKTVDQRVTANSSGEEAPQANTVEEICKQQLPNEEQIIEEKMEQLKKEGRYRVFF